MTAKYPAGLLDWAGNRSGGVRRIFDAASGRPGKDVFSTNLLARLEAWSRDFAAGQSNTPKIILLVGGPGNGKTEAIESTIGWLDDALGAGGRGGEAVARAFSPGKGAVVPRLVRVDIGGMAATPASRIVSIVQDASSVTTQARTTAAQLLLDELEAALDAPSIEAYLCCVNRGVLDDALIESIDTGRDRARTLLEAVAFAVGLSAGAPQCWPLRDHPEVGVWPMDIESLLLPLDDGVGAPARHVLAQALTIENWPAVGTCAAGAHCPHCSSRAALGNDREADALLKILRWHELASGKRWTFRDLFSLMSYLLAGHQVSETASEPCAQTRRLMQADERAVSAAKPTRESSTAIFNLVAAHYQHALFHSWHSGLAQTLRKHIKDLSLDHDNTLMGLQWFLASRRSSYLPAMIEESLVALTGLLDPALMDPDIEVQLFKDRTVQLREIDVRFSRSVASGLEYIARSSLFSKLEIELFKRLSAVDEHLSGYAIRRRKPLSAVFVQRMLRDFACRLARRTIGTRTAAVRDAAALGEFQGVVENTAGDELYGLTLEIGRLFNPEGHFAVSLTTTFGQPSPPTNRRATLIVPERRVRPLEAASSGRPKSPFAFFSVGEGTSSQAIALTYDLFKAVRDLRLGLTPSSLPSGVSALLDTTTARLSGPIVRDRDLTEGARIRIGTNGVVVQPRRAGFVASQEVERRS